MKRILLLLSLCLFLFTIPSKAADVPIRETDVSTASEGNDIVLLNGTFKYLTKEEILSRINEIRLEACKEGVPDPRNSSRSLSEGDYVAIKWSSDLEWIAQTRAAEATVHMDHTRPNNKKWSGVSHDGISSFAEDLAWNSSADILYGINQWYDEKADWVNQNSSAVTGHYTSIINPQYTYIGIGAFKPSTGYGAVAGELRTGSGLNEEQTGAQGSYQQKVEIIKAKLTISSVTEKTIHIGKSETLSLNAETSYENNLGSSWSPKVSQVSLMGTTEWETNDSTIADVNNQGLVTGASAGTAIITAKYNGNDYKTNITVEDHKWVEQSTTPPTCTEPGRTTYKCSVCNQTHDEETAATGHSWDAEYTVDKEATCTKDGSESIHCKNCEATKDSKVIPALGHKAGEAVIENKVDSTCTKEGSYDEVIYCTVCKEEISREKKVIEKKDHSWDEGVVTREATKDLPGIRTFTCSVCGETYTVEIPYEHTVHSYEVTVVKPTCTEGGYTLHTCSECGESYKDNETDALGHDYDEKVTKEPSCEEDGVKTYTCSVCGDTFTEPISKTGHSWDAEYTVDQEATCTKDGSESIHCKNCEATKDSKVIPALGHKAGEAVVENKVDSTCTKEGSYDEVIYCTVCKEEISREKKVIEKKDHSWDEGVVTREATKDLPGIKTFTCTVCEETYTLEIPYDHTVHTYEETVVEPTCTEGGYTLHTCSECGESYKDNETDALGHDYDEKVTKEPSCEEDGVKTYTCSVCGDTFTEPISKTGHSWDEDYTVDKEANCTEGGSKSIHCKKCDATKDEEVIPALGHTPGEAVVENKVDATCTEEGSYDEVIYCTTCNKEISREKKAIEKKDHSWDEGVITREATKDLPGIRTFTCSVCGETYTVEIPYGHTVHSYEVTVVKPTCTEGGYTLHTCSECGESYKDNETDAVGHDYNEKVTKEPSCEEDGVKTYTCSVCGDTFTEPISKTGHSWDAEYTVDKEANCTEAGSKSIHCKKCEATKDTESIPALGHKAGEAVIENKVNATCTKEGSYDEVIYCTVCKEEISREKKVIEKKDHSWNEGVVTKEATEDEEGERTYTCTVCGEKKTEVIPALTHEHEYISIVIDPTCTEGGYTLYTCSCGDSYRENEKEALGHSYKEEVTKEATCEEAGEKRCTCERCWDTYTDEIPATGHKPASPVKENEIAATFDSEGSYDSVVYCSVCKKELSRETVVTPKLEMKDQTISAAKTSYVFTFNSVKAQSQALSISGAHGTLSFTSGNTKVYAKDGKLYVAKAAPAGTYTIKVTAAATEDGEYKASNTITITVKVGKAANTIKATPATKKFKAAKVKKKAQSFKIKVTQAQGRITFKSSSSKVKVTTAGKVTVKKGTKKGKYRITVTAAGNGNYKQGVKTITVVIK